MRKLVLGLLIFGTLLLLGCSTIEPTTTTEQTTFECVKPCHAYFNLEGTPACVKQTVGDSQVCTEDYRWEDTCLRYFTCGKTDDGCNTVDTGYKSCIDCVKTCVQTTDVSNLEDCTSQC